MAAILIVEDRPIDRKFVATLLKSEGYAVVEAADGIEGLRSAVETPPDLVISDILMPTADGYEFVRRMREDRRLARVPVIFYSATYHEREARALAARCGAAVLTKPSEPKVILATVADALRRGQAATLQPEDAAQFDRDHLHIVSSALATKIDDLEASEHRMAAIVDVAHQIAAERDPRAVLQTVCAAARDVTLAQQSIAVLTDEAPARNGVVTSGIDALPEDLLLPAFDAPILLPVLRERRPVRARGGKDASELLRVAPEHEPTYSYLLVPIATSHRTHGYLLLRNKVGANEFTDVDEAVALALATHAAIAYENARLYEDLRTHATALEQEVAERKRIERALRDNEERTRFALAASATDVWEWDLTNDRVSWSATTSIAFGMKPSEAATTSGEFLRLVHEDDRARFSEITQHAIAEHKDLAIEFRSVWPDGSIHWIDSKARVAYGSDGKPVRILGTVTDVTDRKSLEEQFRQAQKMEAVGQLAGGVAHDFNNLLTAIQGYGDLVRESLTVSDRRRADMDEVLRAAERAVGLNRQLLAFSRKQVLQPTVLDLNALVTDTSRMLRRLIGEDIDLITRLAPGLDAVRADAGQIEQVLMNLAVNARDAMPGGGCLTIETSNIDLDETYAAHHVPVVPGPYVMVAVRDTGTGIDATTQQRIFEPFFTTKERGRGTGLGLATVYGIVKQSGGYIWVDSELGRGTTFEIHLPRAKAAAVPAHRTVAQQSPPTGSETIMLVEDEDAVRSLAHSLLERAGYQVVEVQDPRRAEAILRDANVHIDLLVTDVIMPGLSGPGLFARLSENRSGLKVLYISGYTDDAIVHQAGLSEDVVFLQKPFSAHSLLCKVREALER